jgi:hypothetical protein
MGTTPKRSRTSTVKRLLKTAGKKSWGAACNANWIGQELEKLANDYAKLQKEDVNCQKKSTPSRVRWKRLRQHLLSEVF